MISPLYAKIILYIATISYGTAFGLYIYSIPKKIQDGLLPFLIDLIITIGFLLLTIQSYRKLKEVSKDPKLIKQPSIVFDKVSQYGWGLIALYFILLYVPNDLHTHTAWYYPIGILAYYSLFLGKYIGIYLLMIFYLISIGSNIPNSTGSLIAYLTKICIFAYIGTYAYQYPTWHVTFNTPLL